MLLFALFSEEFYLFKSGDICIYEQLVRPHEAVISRGEKLCSDKIDKQSHVLH